MDNDQMEKRWNRAVAYTTKRSYYKHGCPSRALFDPNATSHILPQAVGDVESLEELHQRHLRNLEAVGLEVPVFQQSFEKCKRYWMRVRRKIVEDVRVQKIKGMIKPLPNDSRIIVMDVDIPASAYETVATDEVEQTETDVQEAPAMAREERMVGLDTQGAPAIKKQDTSNQDTPSEPIILDDIEAKAVVANDHDYLPQLYVIDDHDYAVGYSRYGNESEAYRPLYH